jgi:hypothetical protein
MTGAQKLCTCGHPESPHILVCYDKGNPFMGGLMFCQELATCRCVHTWGPEAGGVPLNPDADIMPPPSVIEEWRQALLEERQG